MIKQQISNIATKKEALSDFILEGGKQQIFGQYHKNGSASRFRLEVNVWHFASPELNIGSAERLCQARYLYF